MITISTDYLRKNLKNIILAVNNGEEVVLEYGKKVKVKLVPFSVTKKNKTKKIIQYFQQFIAESKNRKPDYRNNRELYDDVLSNFI